MLNHLKKFLIAISIFGCINSSVRAVWANDQLSPSDIVLQSTTEITAKTALNGAVTENALGAQLSESELKSLSNYDLTILIDQSGSMNGHDCSAPRSKSIIKKLVYASNKVLASASEGLATIPAGKSRWHWAVTEALNCCKITAPAYPDGITISSFGLFGKTHEHVTPDTLNILFKNRIAFGGTYPSALLDKTMKNYFKKRDSGLDPAKPLLIAVLTDGGFDTGNNNQSFFLRRVINSASKRMINEREIVICFCQVGAAIDGGMLLSNLRRRLYSKKAKYHIAHFVNFSTLRSVGLAKILSGLVGTNNNLTNE